MKTGKALNTSLEDIEKRKFNIFIGISLGNKYFSKENIKKYIEWALENTKDDVLVVIADENHSLNYEVFNRYDQKKAKKVALNLGQEIKRSVEKIVKTLPSDDQSKINIAVWQEIKGYPEYEQNLSIIESEFANNIKFHDFIVKIVKENLGSRAKELSPEDLDKLTFYVLDEIATFIDGMQYKGKIYNLHPYPGLSSLDDLLVGLDKGTLFKKLSDKLKKRHIAIVEGYVDV